MTDEPIDLRVERNKRERPSPELITRDDYGREMFVFVLTYEMNGKSWGAEVVAYDFDDAQARVDAMRQSLVLNGKLYDRIPL